MQIRYMKTFPPPVRILVPGRVYRRDNLDLTHTPMFQQFEGAGRRRGHHDGGPEGDAADAARASSSATWRSGCARASSPTPSPAPKWTCRAERAAAPGCSVCKGTGWLEILGSGMVHPAVFEAVGYDPERVTGFAFGTGVERLAMLKYGVDDIRLFYESDLRFLEQFPL